MATVRVSHAGIADLAADCDHIATGAHSDLRGAVEDGLRVGKGIARANAKRTAGKHGKHYPNSITSKMLADLVGEYGPDSAYPQGGMSFEYGSRNQPPHLDLARSADVAGPALAEAVRKQIDEWFW